MTKKKTEQFNVRLEPDLLGWFDRLIKAQKAAGEKTSKTKVIERLLTALREGRLHERPRGPDAFPAETVKAGTSPDFPILIGVAPDPDDLLMDAFPKEAADVQ